MIVLFIGSGEMLLGMLKPFARSYAIVRSSVRYCPLARYRPLACYRPLARFHRSVRIATIAGESLVG